jgi:hypothetical protein
MLLVVLPLSRAVRRSLEGAQFGGILDAPQWTRTPRTEGSTRPSTLDAPCRCVRGRPDRPFYAGLRTHRTHRTNWLLSNFCHAVSSACSVELSELRSWAAAFQCAGNGRSPLTQTVFGGPQVLPGTLIKRSVWESFGRVATRIGRHHPHRHPPAPLCDSLPDD